MSVKPNSLYKLERVPLGMGTFSEVFPAEHRQTGERVALKRARARPIAQKRIQREIEVQKLLAPHPNIMPILDHDPGFAWYTMPIAQGTIKDLRGRLGEDDLASILADLAGALETAHRRDLVHRDISLGNILALDGEAGQELRWVVADWGMVRRPYGSRSPRLTRTGAPAGTPGFDAPELVSDAQHATAAADVYGLGRVAAWFLTGQMPTPGHPLLPDGPSLHWRIFVKACTEHDLLDRLATMADLREALTQVFTWKDEPPAIRVRRLLDEVIGRKADLGDIMVIAAGYPNDAPLYLDQVARVPTGRIRLWVPESSQLAAQIAIDMTRHLRTSSWGDRDPEYAATPLTFVFTILQTLTDIGQLAEAQDVATSFFAADAAWSQQRQRSRTVRWLSDLQAPADAAIAPILGAQPRLVDYYRDGLSPRSFALKAIFRV